jgi:hypothetical protein
MKIKIRALYLLITFFLISMSGYGQLNQFLIGNHWYYYSGQNGSIPAAWTDPVLKPQFFQNMITAKINTIAGGDAINYNDYDYAASMGLKVIPDKNTYFPINPPSNIIGYKLKDEPKIEEISLFVQGANEIRSRNSNMLIWANLYPSQYLSTDDHQYREGYLQKYINEIKPNILSFDDYPVWYNQLYNNKSNDDKSFFRTLYTFGTKSVENSIPFFYILTPIRSTTSNAQWDFSQTETTEEFRYCIYSALIYGAKGINYWPGFEWMLTHHGPECNGCETYYSVTTPFSNPTRAALIDIHSKLTTSSDNLLKLNFASAYHYTTDQYITKTLARACTTVLFADSSCNNSEELQCFEFWHGKGGNIQSVNRPGFGIAKDEYAKFIFTDPTNPINLISNNLGASADNMRDFAVSFMTDSDHGIYFWVMNKGLIWGHSFTLNFNINKVSSYTDVLNAPNSSYNPNSSIYLEPGEAKLFKVNKTNINDKITVNICNTNYAFNNPVGDYNTSPLVTADIINIGGSGCPVTFESGTYSSFMAHNIHIGKGTHIMSGSHVHLKKYTDSNTKTNNQQQSIKRFEPNNETRELEKTTFDRQIKIFPNPTKGDFIVSANLSENETAEIKLFDNMGRVVKILKTNSPETNLSLSNEPAGIFFVRVGINDIYYNYKIIKL